MLNTVEIQRLIPHRFPFLFLDTVSEVKNWESAIGHKSFTINEHFFAGHFPDHPVVPGVILVEAMAQLATLCVAYSYQQEKSEIPNGVAFMSIDNAKFRKPVVPGDQVTFVVTKQIRRNRLFKFSGEGFVKDIKVCDTQFTAISVEK